MQTALLSERFKQFAMKECRGSSSLYEYLSESIAQDEELLRLASHAMQEQPVPNLFLGAVHYLLLQGINHELRECYSSIVSNPKEAATAFPYFKDFCMSYTAKLIPILMNRRVQTNEVRRCAYLYPVFCYIHELTKRPLALIEIGTSAGLQLLWDRYSYSYNGSEEVYGDSGSALVIHSQILGNSQPFLLKASPPVTSKMGIDLHVMDLNNEDDHLWLKSLIWPEHIERRMNFEKAAQLLKEDPVDLIEGDGVKKLPELAPTIPLDSVLCVFHTHVANQLSKEDKCELLENMRTLGEARDVFHLYNNIWDTGQIHLDYYLEGKEYKEILAETDGHGRWFQWKL